MQRTQRALFPLNFLQLLQSTSTLARMRWRQHWVLLLVIYLGMTAAVVIVCAVPLFSQAMSTAGLRSLLVASPTTSQLDLTISMNGVTSAGINELSKFIPFPPDELGSYLDNTRRLDIETSQIYYIPEKEPEPGSVPIPYGAVSLFGTSIPLAAPHITLLQGRLPQQEGSTLEGIITQENAEALHIGVGSELTLSMLFLKPSMDPFLENPFVSAKTSMQIVGIFTTRANDPFWNNVSFKPTSKRIQDFPLHPVLVSSQTLLSTFDQITPKGKIGNTSDNLPLAEGTKITFRYNLDLSQITFDKLDDLITRLTNEQKKIDVFGGIYKGSDYSTPPHYMSKAELSSPLLREVAFEGSFLERYRDRLLTYRIPVGALALQIIALLIFFLCVLTELLVDRQEETIMLMRSRGASVLQVVAALLTQGTALAVLSVLTGPLLALFIVNFAARQILPAQVSQAVDILFQNPWHTLSDIRQFILLTLLVVLVSMGIALFSASRRHMLTGQSRKPIWQRFYLDIVAASIALLGYLLSVSLTSPGVLFDAQTQTLLLTPLTLMAPIFLALAVILLFLRAFPRLLRMAANLALRGRDAVPMLALVQAARASRPVLRMTLLLALSVAFALFSLIFVATQDQRAVDMATFETGADFSGDLSKAATQRPAQETIALYQKAPGVLAATVGLTGKAYLRTTGAYFSVQMRAIDPVTFTQATRWREQDASPTLPVLMNQLTQQHETAISKGILPVIVDVATANRLLLHPGATFTLENDEKVFHCIVLAIVQHIPTIVNATDDGGVMVDFQSFAAIRQHQFKSATTVTNIWLNSSDNPAVLEHLREALATPELSLNNQRDRRELIQKLRTDPMSHYIIGMLAVGATTTLLLTLLGNLLQSWWRVRSQLSQFVVLRALGSTPRQLARVLLWEQCLIYSVSLLLGGGIGLLLAFAVIPSLTFTSVPASSFIANISNASFLIIQQIFPVQVVLPALLGVALLIFLLICLLSVSMMVRVALHRTISEELRLDEEGRGRAGLREEVEATRIRQRHRVASRPVRLWVAIGTLTRLSWLRLRRTWFLQGLASVALIAAVTMTGAVPLIFETSGTDGLSEVLDGKLENRMISLELTTSRLSSSLIQTIEQRTQPLLKQNLGPYLKPASSLFMRSPGLQIISPASSARADTVQVTSGSIERIAPYIDLKAGRLPHTTLTNGEIEILLTPTTARILKLHVGDPITVSMGVTKDQTEETETVPLKLRVVGIFQIKQAETTELPGNDLEPASFQIDTTFTGGSPVASNYSFLSSTPAFLAAIDQLAASKHSHEIIPANQFTLLWHYSLDSSRVAIYQFYGLLGGLVGLQTAINQIPTIPNKSPYLVRTSLYNTELDSYSLPRVLQEYRTHLNALRLPLNVLILLISALTLFFVLIVSTLLIDEQAETISALHTRGGSRRQLLNLVAVQAFGLGIIALLVGPVLAFYGAQAFAQGLQSVTSMDVSAAINSYSEFTLEDFIGYTITIVLIAIVSMLLLAERTTRQDVLTMRREAARSNVQPIWQRLNLDIIAGVVALIGYLIALYLTSISRFLNGSTTLLVSTTLSLIAPLFFIIGCLLLSLRGLPLLLRAGAWLANRGRGATSMLALAQASRAPGQILRTTLLLGLAIAFSIFSLTFAASQNQRVQDIAAFESGADFSGERTVPPKFITRPPTPPDDPLVEVPRLTWHYTSLPSVISATVGYKGTGTVASGSTLTSIEIMAVDAKTFAHTAIWPNATQKSLPSLMKSLTSASANDLWKNEISVIVDRATAQMLDLHPGSTFLVNIPSLTYPGLYCKVIAVVEHIPTINNSLNNTDLENHGLPGGILLDYTTYALYYSQHYDEIPIPPDQQKPGTLLRNRDLPLNHVWLHTSDNTTVVQQLHQTLQTHPDPYLRLSNLIDRRQLIDQMNYDGFQRTLILLATIGAIIIPGLALLGNLIASWQHMRKRQINFAILRALGTTSGQITCIFLWEQGIVYVGGLVLGALLGLLFAFTIVPSLAFNNIPPGSALSKLTSENFYLIQRIIPVQVIVPSSLGWLLIVFATIGVVILAMIALRALRPALNNALRVDEG